MDPAEATLIDPRGQSPDHGSEWRTEDQLILLLTSDLPQSGSIRHSLAGLQQVSIGRGSLRRTLREAGRLELQVFDRWMSSRHARLEQASGGWRLSDCGSTNGSRVNGREGDSWQLVDGDLLEIGHTVYLYRRDVAVPRDALLDLEREAAGSGPPRLLTLSADLERRLQQLLTVAATDLSILITGESGSGKEVLANQIAADSERSGKLVAVNCGAIPENLIESELFGATKGAYSGATGARPGLIRAADGGWLFLDEIGDLPLPAQAALLRVLQERQVRALGSSQAVPVDFRLIAATHQDLREMVDRGTFRGDLFARINGYHAELPPLRQRREDFGLLIGALLRAVDGQHAGERSLSLEVVRTLCQYPWPFNVREFRNCLSTACALAGEGSIEMRHLPETVRETEAVAVSVTEDTGERDLGPAQQAHRADLEELLRKYQGNVSALARETGRARSQYQRWFRRYGLDPQKYRD